MKLVEYNLLSDQEVEFSVTAGEMRKTRSYLELESESTRGEVEGCFATSVPSTIINRYRCRKERRRGIYVPKQQYLDRGFSCVRDKKERRNR